MTNVYFTQCEMRLKNTNIYPQITMLFEREKLHRTDWAAKREKWISNWKLILFYQNLISIICPTINSIADNVTYYSFFFQPILLKKIRLLCCNFSVASVHFILYWIRFTICANVEHLLYHREGVWDREREREKICATWCSCAHKYANIHLFFQFFFYFFTLFALSLSSAILPSCSSNPTVWTICYTYAHTFPHDS